MPRYFFDLNGGAHVHDEDGKELSGKAAIETAAEKVLTDIMRATRPGAFSPPLTVIVRSQAGEPIYRATLTVQSAWRARPRGGM